MKNGTLSLEVNDFGPIAKAEIDLRPLTVFVGPSNTGKSYMAILIYALHRHFSQYRNIDSKRIWTRGILNSRETEGNAQYIQEIRNLLASTKLDITADNINPTHLSDDDSITLDKDLSTILQNIIVNQSEHLYRELERCFGRDLRNLKRRTGNSYSTVQVRRKHAGDKTKFEDSFELNFKNRIFNACVPDNIIIDDQFVTNLRHVDSGYFLLDSSFVLDKWLSDSDKVSSARTNQYRILNRSIASYIQQQLSGDFQSRAYYLPADRTGIMHAHTVIVSALIESAAMTGLRPTAHTPLLSGVLADFLERLIGMNERSEISRLKQDRLPIHRLADHMETEMLGGSVSLEADSSNKYPHFKYYPEHWKGGDGLPLMNASSMVSEIAPIVLFLRHIVTKGDVLIIEEPESHLHPAKQVEITRQIAKLINSGIRVILTTHSEWITEELSNIVNRFDISSKKSKHCTNKKTALNPKDVGVWLFEPKQRPKGSVVREILLDKETGVYSDGFDDVARSLHNDWADIADHIGVTKNRS